MHLHSKSTPSGASVTSTETISLIRDGKKGEGGMEVGEEGNYKSHSCVSHVCFITLLVAKSQGHG